MKAEINKSIELVQILLLLSQQQNKTFQRIGNKTYINAINQWFAPFKNHPAVQLTREQIIYNNFVHIKPLRAVLLLDSIIEDTDNELHNWSFAVRDFISDADLDGFFESQKTYYKWILDKVELCNYNEWIDFIEQYFRQKPDDFNLIICPLNGNYGFTIDKNGRQTAYTVRFMPKYDENGNYTWEFDYFAKGIAHEYAHCFVNPIVEKHIDILNKHKDFFDKHTDIPNFYNADYAVINEYFVRAFQIRFMELNKNKFPDFDIQKDYLYQKDVFIFIDNFISALKQFEALNINFSEFYIEKIEKIL